MIGLDLQGFVHQELVKMTSELHFTTCLWQLCIFYFVIFPASTTHIWPNFSIFRFKVEISEKIKLLLTSVCE